MRFSSPLRTAFSIAAGNPLYSDELMEEVKQTCEEIRDLLSLNPQHSLESQLLMLWIHPTNHLLTDFESQDRVRGLQRISMMGLL